MVVDFSEERMFLFSSPKILIIFFGLLPSLFPFLLLYLLSEIFPLLFYFSWTAEICSSSPHQNLSILFTGSFLFEFFLLLLRLFVLYRLFFFKDWVLNCSDKKTGDDCCWLLFSLFSLCSLPLKLSILCIREIKLDFSSILSCAGD